MLIDATGAGGSHGSAAFWLDVADRVIKFLALLVGAAWTWMHYQRSRTYAKKLELDLEGSVFFKDGLYLETVLKLTNLGAARHKLERSGTSCSVWAVTQDLSELPVVSETVFERDNWIEPGESVDDSMVFKIDLSPEAVVWFKVALRVVSREGEWNLTRHIRVEIVNKQRGEV